MMWPQYDWDLWFLLVAVIILAAVAFIGHNRFQPLAEVLLAVVLYVGVTLFLWDWVAFLTWVLFVVAFIAAFVHIFRSRFHERFHRHAVSASLMLARVALSLVVFYILLNYVITPLVRHINDWAWWRTLLVAALIVVLLLALVLLLLRFTLFAVVLVVFALLSLALVTGVDFNINGDSDHHANSETGAPVVDNVNPDAPEAQFSVTHMDGLKVTFDASNSDTEMTHDYTYAWYFGDNSPVPVKTSKAIITHRFAAPDTYLVHVVVTDTTTNADDTSKSVEVKVTKAQTKVVLKEASKCNKVVICGGKKGFKKSQVIVGTGPIPHSKREAASKAFTLKTIKNRAMLNAFLHTDNAKAVMVRTQVRHDMHKAGVSTAQINSCLESSANWVWVAPTVASQVSGTTYPINGKIYRAQGPRGVASNDATWFCVGDDGNIIASSAIRADCMNPGGTSTITPIPAGEIPPPMSCIEHCKTRHVHHRPPEHGGPPSHSRCRPPTHVSPYDHHTCIVPKRASQDVLRNPKVPAQVKGHGTTPVGTSPGSPSKPHDGGTGCGGPCPGSTHTSGPGGSGGSGSGSGSSLPPPTEPPAPPPAQPTQTTDPNPPPPPAD